MIDDHFGEPVAARYDASIRAMFDPAVVDPAIEVLVELAAGGPALELGIGTGRIALPLRAAGVPVHGIELSAAMVARLRAKPGAEQIDVTIGDFAQLRRLPPDERYRPFNPSRSSRWSLRPPRT